MFLKGSKATMINKKYEGEIEVTCKPQHVQHTKLSMYVEGNIPHRSGLMINRQRYIS